MSGIVYLVGSGPGDPKLLTLRAKECLERADVVFYDALAHPDTLRWAKPDAKRIYVGKRSGDHAVPQEATNSLLIAAAKSGKTVVRLKGGDPFVFGRGGEEAEELVAAGIPFEVVPGITSPIAASAYAGIPLTHRDWASSVAFVTGHEDPTKPEQSVRWRKLATGVDTLAILMGMSRLAAIAGELLAGGRAADTPVAVVQWGTHPRQRTLVTTLADVVDDVARAGIGSPAIIVVGHVARLRETLRWFDKKPLFGKRIVVTRAREQASALVEMLTDLGADVLECPTIRTEPVEDTSALDAAIAELAGFDWVVFTSANAVRYFWARLEHANCDARAFGSAKMIAIGPATEAELRRHGVRADFVPKQSRSEAVLQEFGDAKGLRILIPRGESSRDVLRDGWTDAGADVVAVTTYRTVSESDGAKEVRDALERDEIAAVTFTSGSTVENLLNAFGDADAPKRLSKTCVATIGPITSEVARAHGIEVAVEAASASVEALADALVEHFRRLEPSG
jgi:uroporphyrinogen III methyltransferase/synthase